MSNCMEFFSCLYKQQDIIKKEIIMDTIDKRYLLKLNNIFRVGRRMNSPRIPILQEGGTHGGIYL